MRVYAIDGDGVFRDHTGRADEGRGFFRIRWIGSFTLVELLVVISIIALLATLLMPALGKAKQSATAVLCINNFKQIGLGMMNYLEDNNEMMPGCAQYDRNGDYARWTIIPAFYAGLQKELTSAAWFSQVGGVPRNYRIMRCPADGTRLAGDEYCNIGLNSTYADFENGAHGVDKRKMSQFKAPSEMMLAGDSISNIFGADGSSYRISAVRKPPSSDGYKMTRHPGRSAVFLFVDNHADSRNLNFLIDEGVNPSASKFYDLEHNFK